MIDAVKDIPFGYVLCGVIWAIALGFAVGNYACSLVHRLPRGRLILDKKPYCGSCRTPLQVKDLFPVVSALLLRHRCRYCGTHFPVSHTWTEILVGLLFVLAFLQFNFGQEYVLIVCIGVFLITLAAIQTNEGIIMGKMLTCVAVFGMLYRVLLDGEIYGFFNGALYSLIAGAILMHKQIKPTGHVYSLPPSVLLMTVGGLCVGEAGLIRFFALFGLFYAVGLLRPVLMRGSGEMPITVPFGFAVMLSLMYPSLILPG